MHHFYESELYAIEQLLIMMSQKAADSVRWAVQALVQNDAKQAQQVLKLDDEIDAMEKEIDAACVRYLTLRSPVAGDLRLATVPMRACQDLERIADEACSIAKRVPALNTELPVRFDPVPYQSMARDVLEQLNSVMASYLNRDQEVAYQVRARDKAIDQQHRDCILNLIENATAGERSVKETVDLVFISKSLERIGDHAKNISEAVIYLLEGEDVRYTGRQQVRTQGQ
jgi:phosphate transport system protein